MKNRLSILLMFLFVLSGAATAWAALADSRGMLCETAARRTGVESLAAVYEFEEPAERTDRSVLKESNLIRLAVFFGKPDKIRINVTWPDRREVYLAVGDELLAMAGDQAVEDPWPVPAVLFRLILDSDPDELEAMLAARLDLQRFQRRGDFAVLGARTEKPFRGEAWFDCSRGVLVRLITLESERSTLYDVEMSDYRPLQDGIDWPGRLEIKKAPQGPMVLTLKSLTVNPDLGGDSFDLNDLRRSLARPPDRPASRNPDLEKIREMMDWFRQKLK